MSEIKKKIGKRWCDALAIAQGASNPSGICHSLLDAIKEVRGESGDPRKDAACRQIVYQLSYVLGIHSGVTGYGDLEGLGYDYGSDYEAIKENAELYDQQQEKERFESQLDEHLREQEGKELDAIRETTEKDVTEAARQECFGSENEE